MYAILISYKNPLLHALLSLSLASIFTFFNVPFLFLRALHTYIHPDTQAPSNGVRAAIRRPGGAGGSNSGSGIEGYQHLSSKTSAEFKKRNKGSKEKNDFDENNAQIFRLRLDDGHIRSRLYSAEYATAFTLSFVALSCFVLQNYLDVSQSNGILENGVFVPVLLGILGVGKLLISLGKVSFEKSASRRSAKQVSLICSVLGFFFGLMACSETASFVLDFNLVSLDGYGRLLVAILTGCLAGCLFMPADKNVRSFWIGTDQIRCNMSMITGGWFTRTILYVNTILFMLVASLWIVPLAEIFVNTNENNNNNNNNKRAKLMSEVSGADRLLGNVGLSQSDFIKFRQWCLLVLSIMQIAALRSNLQMYLNEALLCWYQRLHASKVPDLDFSRAKVFLQNHYFCLATLQFFVPPVLVLLFLGLANVGSYTSESFPLLCTLLPCSAFVKEVALFTAWWIVLLWAVFTSVILLLFRLGTLYVS